MAADEEFPTHPRLTLTTTLAAALLASACGGAGDGTTTAPTTTGASTTAPPTTISPMTTVTTVAALGSPGRRVTIALAPIVHPQDILDGADDLIAELQNSTGLAFRATVPSSYADTVTALCAAPESTVAILPVEAFVVAEGECGAVAMLVAVRGGDSAYRSEFLVARDGDIATLADLEGLVWSHAEDSPSGYLIPLAILTEAGIAPGAESATVSQAEAVSAVLDGTADFATARFFPTVDHDGTIVWDGTQEGADIPADLVDLCITDSAGDLVCGTLRPRDGRRGVREIHPNVIQRVRILAVSDPIPNELVVFGGGFPLDVRAMIVEALLDLAADDPETLAAGFEAYGWESVTEVTESDLAGARRLLDALGFGLGDL